MKRAIMYLALAIVSLCQSANAVIINGLSYTLGTDEAMLDNDNGNWDGELVIPSEVEYEGKKYTVTQIAWLAFNHCTTLTKVTIPHTVTDIWHSAGYDDCKNPFDGCVNLEAIEVEEGNPSMCSVDGVLYNKDCTRLYAYPGGAKRESFRVPESVTWVGGDAFSRNPYLKAVEIPHSVSFSFGTFTNCSALEQVILPEDLTYTSHMFTNCTSLKSIKIPSGVKGIYDQAFFGCSSLTSMTLPKGVTEVGSLAFMDCSSLQSVVLPSTLSEVGHGMFSGCSALRDVIIPKGVKRISSSAFHDCTSLRVLDLPETLTWLDNNLFNGCNLDALIIRGQISTIFRYTFKDLNETAVIYALDITKVKEVYGGKVLPLSQYRPTAIRDIPQSPSTADANSSFVNRHSSSLYDLQGRRLSAPPARGMYIQDKRVKIRE